MIYHTTEMEWDCHLASSLHFLIRVRNCSGNCCDSSRHFCPPYGNIRTSRLNGITMRLLAKPGQIDVLYLEQEIFLPLDGQK